MQSIGVSRVAKNSRGAPLAANEDSLSVFGRTNVFLLEDVRSNTTVMLAFLKMLGFPPAICTENLAQAASHQSDLNNGFFGAIFLDVMLPDGRSIDLLKRLKSNGVSNVFAYTALGSPQEKAELLASGFDFIFTKPLTLNMLQNNLIKFLR